MITARALARSFRTKAGPVDAVRGVDLDVQPGEIVGLLGPNGAGKTTTLRMLTTLLMPSSGSATVAGFDLVSQPREVRRNIGYVAQLTRGSMIEALRSNHVRTARAKGMGPRITLVRHAMRGGLLPVLAYLGPATAGIITGSVVVMDGGITA